MNPKSIFSRIRGFSIMGFGVSWNASTSERQIAGKVISFLEDRRVLYNNYELEMPDHCVKSILEIRKFLTEQVGILKTTDSSLTDNLESMSAACRKFLDTVQDSESHIIINDSFNSGPETWTFFTALGELRAFIGVHTAIIAAKYEISINEELAKILPPNPETV